jgi:hypothetical protein
LNHRASRRAEEEEEEESSKDGKQVNTYLGTLGYLTVLLPSKIPTVQDKIRKENDEKLTGSKEKMGGGDINIKFQRQRTEDRKTEEASAETPQSYKAPSVAQHIPTSYR